MSRPRDAMRVLHANSPFGGAEVLARIAERAELPVELISELNGNLNDEGFVQRFADPDATGDPDCAFAIGIYRMEPDMEHPLHLHAAAEFYYILSGSADFTLGDRRERLGPEVGVYIASEMPHAISNPGTDGMELLYVFSTPDLGQLGTVWLDGE